MSVLLKFVFLDPDQEVVDQTTAYSFSVLNVSLQESQRTPWLPRDCSLADLREYASGICIWARGEIPDLMVDYY